MNFSDLTFSDHNLPGATQAQHQFENGWTISVVSGPKGCGLYGNIHQDTFEVAFITARGFMLENVIGWQTPAQITAMMHLIEML